jgi:hypothetical protein
MLSDAHGWDNENDRRNHRDWPVPAIHVASPVEGNAVPCTVPDGPTATNLIAERLLLEQW